MFIWEKDRWPKFQWDASALLGPMAEASRKQGGLMGTMARLAFDLRRDAQMTVLTEEAVRSAEIEGERLDLRSVRSSIARHLGVPWADDAPGDRSSEGMAEMLLDATLRHGQPLTEERLFRWHAALFPTGHSGIRRITAGAWRDDASGPMQVVSGPVGRERMHFVAPPAALLRDEMSRFLDWFNEEPREDGLLRAAIAHLWFVTLHPFDDGNGRIARAVAEMALARAEGSGQLFHCMSAQIAREKQEYHRMLERTQRGDLDVTGWLVWFLECFSRSIDHSMDVNRAVLRRDALWRRHDDVPFTERQRKVLTRYLGDFEGALTAKKWASLGKCSPATALRDITELIERGVMLRLPGGSKNAHYGVVID